MQSQKMAYDHTINMYTQGMQVFPTLIKNQASNQSWGKTTSNGVET